MITSSPHVEAFLSALPPARSKDLGYMRSIIRDAFPCARESMERDHPTFHLTGGTVVGLAVNKQAIVVHVLPSDLLHHFRADLLKYDHGKHCIRFRRMDDEALHFFGRLVRYVGTLSAHPTSAGSHPLPVHEEQNIDIPAAVGRSI